ncbi:MAG: hypothetical protein M1454_05555 [Candidatus Thermoplasmatota archaeon]|nr:hypothetical protein [Candidatus Thermoplasmatota archaeon]MCL5731353.1 hypothetical protein [Candidatus Thermoplasmatota archaeon]
MDEEESIFESFISAIEGTKSTAEIVFDSFAIKLPGMKANVLISGKISVTARPIHEREKQ